MELTQTKSHDKETVITFLFFIFCNIRLISVGGSVICRLPQASLVAVNMHCGFVQGLKETEHKRVNRFNFSRNICSKFCSPRPQVLLSAWKWKSR